MTLFRALVPDTKDHPMPDTTLNRLRQAHYGLSSLPERVAVPATPGDLAPTEMSVTETSLDDIAFAVGAVEGEYNAIGDRLYALRTLYRLARKSGARGTDNAADAALKTER